jgi:hypothetical protein
LKTVNVGLGQFQSIQRVVFVVNDGVTETANQMMMAIGLSFESRSRAEMLQPFHHAEGRQSIENAIDGRSRESREFIFDRFVNLFGSGMIVAFENGTKNLAPLNRQRKPLLTAQGFKL